MTIARRRILQIAAAALAWPCATKAQSYPASPVRIIVATSAGGTTDIVARLIAAWLSERLGQNFLVGNPPGGGNNISTEAAVHPTPDGYTLFMGETDNTINSTPNHNLSVNFRTQMRPVT